VVVNGGSASAAEITAGALRDDRNAELIGEKTFGKGSVQDAMQLEDGSGLHVTIAKWLLPKGDWISGTGIPVNVEVKDDPATPADEVIQKAATEVIK
jgi:carboxyl-terminal processing protease